MRPDILLWVLPGYFEHQVRYQGKMRIVGFSIAKVDKKTRKLYILK
jgi:hypothetical protein